jgi:hypothetical protein
MTLTLPATETVTRITTRARPGVRFFSERFGGRPYDNCMLDSELGNLAWAGFSVQDGDDDVLRYYTGKDDPQPLGFDDVNKALTALYPASGVTVGVADWTFIAANIKRYGRFGRYRAQFSIALHMDKMPAEYRKWCGQSYTGGHSVRLVSRDPHDPTRFYMYDVMQPTDVPPGEDPATWIPGQWITQDVLDAAVFKKNGLIEVSYAYRGGYAGPVYQEAIA